MSWTACTLRSVRMIEEQYQKKKTYQEPSINQATEVKQLIQEQSDCDKASDLFKSGRIVTN